MQFLLDADLSPRLAATFATYGHAAAHVDDEGHGHARDPQIAELARRTGRCIVTADADFGDIREYPPRLYAGIVLLTLPHRVGARYIARVVSYFLERLPEIAPIQGKLVIVELGRIRVRE